MATDNTMSLLNFSCLRNVSQDFVTDIGWIVDHPDDPDSDLKGNGYATAVIVSLFFLTGVPWNLFVIVTIMMKKLYSSPTLMLLLNLAITNLLICLLVMPFNIITGFSGEFLFGDTDAVRCRVCQTSVVLVILPWVSMHTIALMSVDRFIYLKKPLKYSTWITPKRMLCVIVTIWILCTVMSIPPLFGFGEIKFTYTFSACSPYLVGRTHIAPNFYYILLLTAEAIVPITSLFIMYFCVMYIIRKSMFARFQRSAEVTQADTEGDVKTKIAKEKIKSQLRLARVFGAIFTANMLTWLPMVALALTGAIARTAPTILYNITYLSFLSQTVIHPILEVVLIRDMREIITSCVNCCRRKT